jgi:hypothetical protein
MKLQKLHLQLIFVFILQPSDTVTPHHFSKYKIFVTVIRKYKEDLINGYSRGTVTCLCVCEFYMRNINGSLNRNIYQFVCLLNHMFISFK